MAIRVYKPITNGTRQRSVLKSDEITKTTPEKSLVVKLNKTVSLGRSMFSKVEPYCCKISLPAEVLHTPAVPVVGIQVRPEPGAPGNDLLPQAGGADVAHAPGRSRRRLRLSGLFPAVLRGKLRYHLPEPAGFPDRAGGVLIAHTSAQKTWNLARRAGGQVVAGSAG